MVQPLSVPRLTAKRIEIDPERDLPTLLACEGCSSVAETFTGGGTLGAPRFPRAAFLSRLAQLCGALGIDPEGMEKDQHEAASVSTYDRFRSTGRSRLSGIHCDPLQVVALRMTRPRSVAGLFGFLIFSQRFDRPDS